MSFWYEVFPPIAHRLGAISKHRLVAMVYACVTHALQRYYHEFQESIPPEQLSVFDAALADLKTAATDQATAVNAEERINSLNAIAPDMDSDEMAVPGWEYTRIAVRQALRLILTGDPEYACDALDQAYQSIAGEELNRFMFKIGKGLAGPEITEAERAIPACREEIAFQLQCLDCAEEGLPFPASAS